MSLPIFTPYLLYHSYTQSLSSVAQLCPTLCTQSLPFSNTHFLKYSNTPSPSSLRSSCTPIPTNQKIQLRFFMRLSHHSSLSSNVLFLQRTFITMQYKLVLPGTLYPTILFYFLLRTYHTISSCLVLLCIIFPIIFPQYFPQQWFLSLVTEGIFTILVIVIPLASGTQ